jgi:ABC-2 type transport system permease protein
MTAMTYWRAFRAIIWRELLRFLNQKGRFFAALLRPLVWLLVFAVSFRSALGVSIIPPYETYITYEIYILPGLIGMVQLFNGMQTSLSMVYDREMGSMRILLTTPLPRWFLLTSRLAGGVFISLLQVYAFLAIAALFGIRGPWGGWLVILPLLVLTGLLLGALGMILASLIRQLENFAGVMNFVIFPMFFLSPALYPLWRVKESSVLLYELCRLNPFTYAVEVLRFGLYLQINWAALGIVAAALAVALALGIWAYDPARGILGRRGKAAGGTGPAR